MLRKLHLNKAVILKNFILNKQAENNYSNDICVKSLKFINSTAHYSKREMLMVYWKPDTVLGAENAEMSTTKSMP